MQKIRILLVDSTDSVKKLLEDRTTPTDSVRFVVTHIKARSLKKSSELVNDQFDVILFGEKVSQLSVIRSTKAIRATGLIIPILVLTRQSEARVPRNYQKAGIDEMLNSAEVSTPLFTWILISTLKQIETKKKVHNFDVIRNRLRTVNESLKTLSHDINNPLSVIRLALYQLENPNLPKLKRERFFKLLSTNVEKVDSYIKELRLIRRQLGEDTTTLTNVLSLKPLKRIATER
ncbi:MAG: hypothetical protein HY707_01735 [Ignavibacteriae bacterium]|nr:hypothetical protein [Ignavibacteriota bacterium]